MSEFESELWRDVFLHSMRAGFQHAGAMLAANDAVDAYRAKCDAGNKPKAPARQGAVK